MADMQSVKVAVHREISVDGRKKQEFVESFKRYLHVKTYQDLIASYPPSQGFIVSLLPIED